MIKLDHLVFNSFQVNTYIVSDETGECVIVDPACYSEAENENLRRYLEEKRLKPVLIINTHCHIDHLLGVQFAIDTYRIKFLAHSLEIPMIDRAPIMGDIFGFTVEPVPHPDRTLEDGEIIRFGNSSLEALLVPGHSEGSLAFYSLEGGFVITGDALFAGSIGRTDLPGGDYDTLIESIRTKLLPLPAETEVWAGHGQPSSIGEEIRSNHFLK